MRERRIHRISGNVVLGLSLFAMVRVVLVVAFATLYFVEHPRERESAVVGVRVAYVFDPCAVLRNECPSTWGSSPTKPSRAGIAASA